MCGIAGYIDFKGKSGLAELTAMTQCLTHRGPESGGVKVLQGLPASSVGLGHRRLSIIELSEAGSQPMQFQDLTITFNGEIYNYVEIKQELEGKGHVFNGNSDTEVILQSYRAWGTSCVERFIGMFAFVIHDHTRNILFCARDRAGVKPFFYYQQQGLFLFASELKSFLKHPGFVRELNPHAVAAFIQFGNVPSPHCIYKHCYKLEPGHHLSIHLDTGGIEKKCYWDVYDFYNRPKLSIDFDSALEQTEKLLQSAFQYRMVADVPVGIFLSGGYDSACLTALLQKNRAEKLRTFTIGVPDIGLNEAPYASEVASYLGTEHTEIMCTQEEVMNLIDELPFFYDEPFADSSAIPTTLVCKMARHSVKVALSADGGDETFAGYNRYDYLIKYQRLLKTMPPFIRKSTYHLMDQLSADRIPFLNNTYNFHNRYEKLKLLLRDPSAKNMMLSLSKQYDESQLHKLFTRNVLQMNTAYQSNELLREFYTPLSYMMAVDYQTYLVDDILQKVDRASMSVSLEAREPFLDHRIIEWAAALPDDFKYHQGEKKYILKQIVHRHIPRQLLDRPKMGFAIPITTWLMNELRPRVEQYLEKGRITRQGIFDPEEIEKVKSDFFHGKKELSNKIWYLLMFQMWHSRWMEQD